MEPTNPLITLLKELVRQITKAFASWWFKAIVAVLLPIQPVIFAIIVALIGLLSWVVKPQTLPFSKFFLVFAILGSLGELMAASPAYIGVDPIQNTTNNQIAFWDMSNLQAWNQIDGMPKARFAEFQRDGFWRLYRINPQSGVPTEEIFINQRHPVIEGQVYTQSFYFRHDGSFYFAFTFFTEKGHHMANATIVDMGNGLKRAYASYTVQPGDRWLRVLDLGWVGGNWAHIDIGFAILEQRGSPSYYARQDLPNKSLFQKLVWWVGVALLGILVLKGSQYLLKGSEGPTGTAILIGLLTSSLWVVVRGEFTADGRAMGFTTEPNLLGHQAVLMGGLAGLLLKPHWAKGLVLIGAGLMVFLSGSRGSLLALVPLGIAWWWGLGSQRRIKILAIAIFIGASILLSKVNLGHLANSFDLQANSSKIRLEVWKVALERIKHNPIIGLGQTGFVPYYLQHRPPNALSPWIGHTHNVFLQLWVEAGLLGLLGFVVLWGKVAWEVWHRKNTAAGLLLLAAIVLNLVDYTWFYSGVYYPLWVAMAWMINLDEQAAS